MTPAERAEEEQSCLDCLAIFAAQYGYPPSFRDVAWCANLPTQTAHGRLRVLRAQGLVDWDRRPRTLRLTDAGRARLSRVVAVL